MSLIYPTEQTSAFPVVNKASPARGKEFTTALRQQARAHQETSLARSPQETPSRPKKIGHHFEKGTILDIFA